MGASTQSTLGSNPIRIGVTLCLDRGQRIRPGRDYWYLHRAYTTQLRRVGAIPVLLSPDTPVEACAALCEGLLLTGGGDLPDTLAGEDLPADWPPAELRHGEERERIEWELSLLRSFQRRGAPVLGVCFGMQLMNLAYGGTLARVPADEAHGTDGNPCRHLIRVDPRSALLSALGTSSAEVCSAHRQCVGRVAEGLRAVAWSPGSVVEAVEGEGAYGVEWHPESDATGDAVYARFVQLVRLAHSTAE